jgi:hypothetical protein
MVWDGISLSNEFTVELSMWIVLLRLGLVSLDE